MMKKNDMIPEGRIRALNDRPEREGDHVLYWMQASQRAHWNHALEYSAIEANRSNLPLVVCFGLMVDFPEANLRHIKFMVEGLEAVRSSLKKRGIPFIIRRGSPPDVALELSSDASMIVCDMGYLRMQREWRRSLARKADLKVVQVESDAVVPVEVASDSEQHAAYTIRPRIHKKLYEYLIPLEERRLKNKLKRINADTLDPSDPELLKGADDSVAPVEGIRGGTQEAMKRLERFLDLNIDRYGDLSNDPALDVQSGLGPYLHFGQISPLYIALRAMDRGGEGSERFLEQLIVRRELSLNFAHYNDGYDRYDSIPQWAKDSLEEHAVDMREYVYSIGELERADTHDIYWNAAQTEMVRTGRMHGYMRMYWAKKILEWSHTPQEAHRTALILNNRYFIDGRDPNGYTGVAWCFGKHDHPWSERQIFGKVRYMNDKGLRRKFDMDVYISRVSGGDK